MVKGTPEELINLVQEQNNILMEIFDTLEVIATSKTSELEEESAKKEAKEDVELSKSEKALAKSLTGGIKSEWKGLAQSTISKTFGGFTPELMQRYTEKDRFVQDMTEQSMGKIMTDMATSGHRLSDKEALTMGQNFRNFYTVQWTEMNRAKEMFAYNSPAQVWDRREGAKLYRQISNPHATGADYGAGLQHILDGASQYLPSIPGISHLRKIIYGAHQVEKNIQSHEPQKPVNNIGD